MSKKDYKEKFKNSELLSDRIKNDKSKLINDLEERAEMIKNEFENEIVDMNLSDIESIYEPTNEIGQDPLFKKCS